LGADDVHLGCLTDFPSNFFVTPGQFNVWVESQQVWNRKEKGEFPEMKELKQLVRNIVDPEKHLGHSEGKKHHHHSQQQQQQQQQQQEKEKEEKKTGENGQAAPAADQTQSKIEGEVCVDCKET